MKFFGKFILGIAILASISACQKEYDCMCITSYSGTGSSQLENDTTYIKSNVKCMDYEYEINTIGLIATVTCKK